MGGGGGGGGNFATSICFKKFVGELLKPDIYMMNVLSEVEMCVLDARKQWSLIMHACLRFHLPYLMCIR